MEGAHLRPEEPDLSIPPPTRDPAVASDGQLIMPHRSYRSRVTFDSSRLNADDGFREYSSINQTDFCPLGQRGLAQTDDAIKMRSATVLPHATTAKVAPREKNAQCEQLRIPDGEGKAAKKMLGGTNFAQAFEPRPSSETVPGKAGFGCAVPRHTNVYQNDFQTTSRHDFTGEVPDPAFPDGTMTAQVSWRQ